MGCTLRLGLVNENVMIFAQVLLVGGDQQVWAEGFGFQDAKKKVPATAASVYRVGSVSKLFTDEAATFLLGTGPAGNLYSSVNDLSKRDHVKRGLKFAPTAPKHIVPPSVIADDCRDGREPRESARSSRRSWPVRRNRR